MYKKKIIAFVCALVMVAGFGHPMNNTVTVHAEENDSNIETEERYAEILYDKKYGRYYTLDDNGNKMPLTSNYISGKDGWYTVDEKKLKIVESAKFERPDHEYPDISYYLTKEPSSDQILSESFKVK